MSKKASDPHCNPVGAGTRVSMRRAALAGAAVTVGLAACGGGGSYATVVDKIKNTGTVVVGTKWDQPGLGLKMGSGEPQGFDADVARYLVNHLTGGNEVRIIWREAP